RRVERAARAPTTVAMEAAPGARKEAAPGARKEAAPGAKKEAAPGVSPVDLTPDSPLYPTYARAKVPPDPENPVELQVVVLQRAVFPSLMAAAIGLDGKLDATGYRAYLDALRRAAGSPSDPVELMCLELLALAFLRAGQLQSQAGLAED